MVDFDFYTNTYLGQLIPEEKFPSLALKATKVLECYERAFTMAKTDNVSRNMAICAMAEEMQKDHLRSRHKSASLGSARVEYAQPEKPLEQRLQRVASAYMIFYRGVS